MSGTTGEAPAGTLSARRSFALDPPSRRDALIAQGKMCA
jgi:hypothetical protein